MAVPDLNAREFFDDLVPVGTTVYFTLPPEKSSLSEERATAPTCFGRVGGAVSALTDHFSGVWWACVEDSWSHPTLRAIPHTGRDF